MVGNADRQEGAPLRHGRAKDEREATAGAAEEFQIPPALRFKIAVTKVSRREPQ